MEGVIDKKIVHWFDRSNCIIDLLIELNNIFFADPTNCSVLYSRTRIAINLKSENVI
jgi:hypothetical protein